MKIVYCLNSIQEIGGISKVVKLKATQLGKLGHEVFIAVTDHDPDKFNEIPNYSIINLNINYYKDDWKSKYHVLKGIFIKRLKHKRRLGIFLNKIQPDIVISVGQSEKYFLPEIKGNWKTIREFHYDKQYRLRRAETFFHRVFAKIINLYDYKFKINQYDIIVVLTSKDRNLHWKNNPKVRVIPNPIPIDIFKISDLENQKILAVGRLVKEKNFISLIRAFKKVVEINPGWILHIYGEGELKGLLEKEIIKHNLCDNVMLMNNHPAITTLMKDYSMFVMSSLYEGLPMAMLEAMASGLPLISYDCPYGPGQLIKDGENGYLVPVNDEITLAEKICDLIKDYNGRKEMGRMSYIKAQKYNQENVCDQWINLFKKLKN